MAGVSGVRPELSSEPAWGGRRPARPPLQVGRIAEVAEEEAMP